MFSSLAQTLLCVLLVQSGLYALHLSGNGNSGDKSLGEVAKGLQSSSSSSSSSPSQPIGPSPGSSGAWQTAPSQQQQHQQHPGGSPPGGGSSRGPGHRSAAAAAFDATTVRLNKEIADMAQLERERLMILAREKQTAESQGNHRGHPFITGRIQMQPSEELDVGDYPALLQQAARGYIFGNVQKQPPSPLNLEEDYEQLREMEHRPVKYYGRVVQPEEREQEQQQAESLYEPLHSFGDFDDFSELEQEPDPPHLGEDELLRELDAYQYHGLEEDPLPENPYRTLEQLELAAPDSLQQLFEQEQEQRDAPMKAMHSGKTHTNPGGYNIRTQQKWARKRNGQGLVGHSSGAEKQLQRQIFAQHFKPQRSNGGKLSLSANAEATASKHLKPSSRSGSKDTEKPNNGLGGSASSSPAAEGKPKQQQQPAEQQQSQDKKDPSHKRSGGTVGSPGGGYSAQPPMSHSIASQLMLRTARGQRQYDVPQIECPTAMDGMERFACPIPDRQGRYRCIDDHVLCDGFIDCPDGEDEDRRSCMFYKTTKAHLDVLADALLRWARGR
ncbi:putative mediator of RNA polymerase II transcription subunit 26 [Drosophila serrata]|uniref:putative mediator of RNA polymerase II transcription subunit 26 n=1 Tax=Drosophila serrata TaxID=7274 RepID=UPI000A1CF8B0|nr:putative mediator of RNA polymerase II transcription subunit 26 [Drosophila serrata]